MANDDIRKRATKLADRILGSKKEFLRNNKTKKHRW